MKCRRKPEVRSKGAAPHRYLLMPYSRHAALWCIDAPRDIREDNVSQSTHGKQRLLVMRISWPWIHVAVTCSLLSGKFRHNMFPLLPDVFRCKGRENGNDFSSQHWHFFASERLVGRQSIFFFVWTYITKKRNELDSFVCTMWFASKKKPRVSLTNLHYQIYFKSLFEIILHSYSIKALVLVSIFTVCGL